MKKKEKEALCSDDEEDDSNVSLCQFVVCGRYPTMSVL